MTGVVVVEESHLSIHTWPEHGYAAVDFFTCGDAIPETAHRVLSEGLRAEQAEVIFVDRGFSHTGPSMRMRSHSTEHFGERAYERARDATLTSVSSDVNAGAEHLDHIATNVVMVARS